MALEHRKALLFGKTEEQELGTTGLFNLFTTLPWHIHKHSSLLALHLTTIGLFIMLLLLYSFVALYPIATTFAAANYQNEFVVVYNRNEGGDEPDYALVSSSTCPKLKTREGRSGVSAAVTSNTVRTCCTLSSLQRICEGHCRRRFLCHS